MALPEPFGGPSTGNREPPSYAGNASIAERNWLLLLAGLGELDFNAKLDFGQDLIEPRVPGAGFQVGRRGAQTGDGGRIERPCQQSDLEIVEHIERGPTPGDGSSAALGGIFNISLLWQGTGRTIAPRAAGWSLGTLTVRKAIWLNSP